MKSSLLLLTAQLGFILLTITYFFFFLRSLTRGVKKTSWPDEKKKRFIRFIYLVPTGICAFVSIWSATGLMADFSNFPLNFAPVILLPLLIVILLMFSSSLTEVLLSISQHKLIQYQSFRFFVEILLWVLFIDGLLPEQMSFEGRNFDILAGITAVPVAYFASRGKLSKAVLITWNFICLALLINIVTIAILSAPSPIRIFFQEPANTIVAYFPVSLLPGLLVPLAYTLHFFSLKQLLYKPKTSNAAA